MNPPVSYGGMQDSGRNPAFGQTAYGQAYDQTAWQPNAYSQATGYMQQPAPYNAFPGDGRNAYGSQNTYFQNRPEPEERTAARPERGWFPQRETPAPQNNISYMPGFSPDAGSSFTHVEHIMTMTGLRSCYEAIACMKNGETLIVMMDAIANESESMRCQDMLAGAAFTLLLRLSLSLPRPRLWKAWRKAAPRCGSSTERRRNRKSPPRLCPKSPRTPHITISV